MNTKKHNWDPPEWLKNPKAKHVIFHDKEVEVYEGQVDVKSIRLWRENDRTSLDIEHLASESGAKDVNKLSDDEIISYVIKNSLHHIVELAKSIKANGVRVPMTLTYNKELLDGNRRFIACKYLLDTEKKKESQFEVVTVHCLKPGISKELRYKIISEMNFLPDHKERWPQGVRAKYICKLFDEYKEKYGEKKAIGEVTFLLDIKKADIYRFTEVLDMINEYVKLAEKKSDEAKKEAEIFARDKFQLFEEFYNKDISKKDKSKQQAAINEDKELFYEYLYNKQLISITGVRDFATMLQYPSVRNVIRTKKETLDYAKSIYDDIALPKRSSSKIERFCEWLEGLSKKEIKDIHPDVKKRLMKAIQKLGSE